jgi:putative membrane fusion protein
VVALRRRPGGDQLRIIKGGERGPREKWEGVSREPANILLLALALFLLAQVLLGWLWGSFNRSAGRVVPATEGSVDISVTTGGILTFEEELVFAPQSGFVQYQVIEGERVPAGKELAVITTFPQEDPIPGRAAEGGQEVGDYLQRFRLWLLDDRGAADPFSDILFPYNNASEVFSPRAGMVILQLDGWEMFGPQSSYVYLDDEEFNQKKTDAKMLSSGEQIARFTPILRIINNYQWYYSTVLLPDPGKLIAEEARVQLLFSFAPEQPVQAQKVEVHEREKGEIEITWRINQAVGDFYSHRWCTAEIVYDSMEGVFIPASTILEQDGSKGVYTVERGIVTFREVTKLAEQDGLILVEGLDPHERIIARPGRVKEGQRFLW